MALESFDVAKASFEIGAFNSSMNRLYYSAFYVVSALILSHDLEAKSHSGVLRMFSMHFVKTGIISKEMGSLYADLFGWRNEGDYTEFLDFDEELLSPLFDKVSDFIEEVKSKIKYNE